METWLILLAICFLLVCLIFTVIALLVYSGAFEHIDVKAGKPPVGKVTIAYKFARGPYGEVGPLFFEVATIAPDNKAVGIYYDDPDKVPSHRLRYVVACILVEGEQEVDQELVKKFEEEGFKTMVLPQVDYVVHASFPYKSSLSIFIGVKKIYPKMAQYIKEHGLHAHPFLEVYTGSTILYMAPLDQHEQFYAPESLQQFPGEEPYERLYAEPSLDTPIQDLFAADTDDERPETGSLLYPSQIVQAEVVGKVEEQPKEEKNEEWKEKAEEAEGKDSSPEPDSPAALTGDAKKERGSDEESGSSFEDLKLEAEEVSGKPVSQ